jgi:hypothetical protein
MEEAEALVVEVVKARKKRSNPSIGNAHGEVKGYSVLILDIL